MDNIYVRALTGSDIKNVSEMDELSNDYVEQWLEDLKKTEKSEYCYGIFFKKELIGYCTVGGACGAIDVPCKGLGYDDGLLSDVFVKPQYRHKKYGKIMIEYVIDIFFKENPKSQLFLTYLYDELEAFYSLFGFVHVDDTDNIMILKDNK